jgi:hypothetical protein
MGGRPDLEEAFGEKLWGFPIAYSLWRWPNLLIDQAAVWKFCGWPWRGECIRHFPKVVDASGTC